MLHNNYIFHIFAMRNETEAGSAGEQPARNNFAKLNSTRLKSNSDQFRDVLLLSIWLIMPNKTHIIFALLSVSRGSSTYL